MPAISIASMRKLPEDNAHGGHPSLFRIPISGVRSVTVISMDVGQPERPDQQCDRGQPQGEPVQHREQTRRGRDVVLGHAHARSHDGPDSLI